VKFRYAFQVALSWAMALLLLACSSGTGSGPTPPPSNTISVSFLNSPPTSLNASTSTGLIATVSNDNNNAGVTWKVNCGGSSCGTISPASTASGGSATYTAPSAVPTPAAVTITATSVTDNTKSVSASITITSTAPPPPISVSFVTQPPSSMVISTTSNLAATVDNDAKNGGVNWTVSCGSAQCGSFNPTATGSGSSTVYTAPSAVPTPATVTVTATSATDSTKSVSAMITMAATAPSIIPDGTYVYHLSGQDNNLNYYVVGAFTIKNGLITGGEEDYTDAVNFNSIPLVPSSSSITATGGNIQLVFATADSNIGVNGVLTLRGTPVSSTRMLLSEYDSFGAATGSLDLQTSPAAPTGGYAFAINGVDSTTAENQLVIGGVLNFSGISLNTTNSVFDLNDGSGLTLLAQSFSSGSISAPDSFGRIMISLTPSTSGIGSIGLTGYVLDGHTIQLLESQTDNLNADLGGTALAQGTNAGQFSPNSVVNNTYVYANQGQDTNGPVYLGGYFNFASGGSVSGHLIFNDIYNTAGKGNTFSGATYTVNPTGRVVVTNVVPSNLSNITLSYILYLDGNGNGVILGADNIQQTTGLAYQQNGLSDYEGNYAIASQGFLAGPNYEQPYGAVGPVTITSATFNGFTDYTSQDPSLQPNGPTPFDNYPNVPLNGLENNSTGLMTLSGLNSLNFSYSGGFGYYPIDAIRVLAIDLDQNSTGFLMLESTSQLQSKP
jgi:hypothetical protein